MTRAISSPMTETVIDDADSVSADGGPVSADAGSASADDGNVSDLKQQKKGVRISAGTQRGLARLFKTAPRHASIEAKRQEDETSDD